MVRKCWATFSLVWLFALSKLCKVWREQIHRYLNKNHDAVKIIHTDPWSWPPEADMQAMFEYVVHFLKEGIYLRFHTKNFIKTL